MKQVFEQLLQEVYNQVRYETKLDRVGSHLALSKHIINSHVFHSGAKMYKDVQRTGHGLESFLDIHHFSLFAKASKNAKERRREPGGIQIQT